MGEWKIIAMGRPLITERDIIDAAKHGATLLTIVPETIITAAASDEAKRRNIKISFQHENTKLQTNSDKNLTSEAIKQNIKVNAMTIAIGSDHGGFSMKESLKVFLIELGCQIIDVGTDSEQVCDYPDFAYATALLVSSGKAERGIMIDSVGVASAIVANKLPGVRAVSCNNEFLARSSREHNNANVLTLGGKVMGIELVKSIVKIWLDTPFSGGRHQPRVNKITDIENRFFKKS